jgi:hypothetical protein
MPVFVFNGFFGNTTFPFPDDQGVFFGFVLRLARSCVDPAAGVAERNARLLGAK